MKKSILATGLLTAIGVLTLVGSSAQAITWCHDYTLYRVGNKKIDTNKLSPADLRKLLKAHGYRGFNYTTASKGRLAHNHLRPGDVIIFGDSHSGFVNQNGLIDHFIQVFGQSGKKRTKADADKLAHTNHDFKRIFREHPVYAKERVEVWRKVSGKK